MEKKEQSPLTPTFKLDDFFTTQEQRDEEKNQWAKRHNIPLVRIPYYERDNITLEMLLGDEYLYHEGNN